MRGAAVIADAGLRQLLGRKRLVVLGALALTYLLVVWLAAAGSPSEDTADTREAVRSLLLPLLVPLIGLAFATAALGDELRDGTAPTLIVKPIARAWIVLGKLAAATAAGLGVLAPTVLGAHLLAAGAEAPRLLAATLLAVTVGSVLYGAGGVLLSLVTGRALVLALAYVLLWEGAAAGLAPSLAHASIRGRAEAAFDAALGAAPVAPAVVAGPVLMTLTASAVATWRLRRMDVA